MKQFDEDYRLKFVKAMPRIIKAVIKPQEKGTKY